MTQQSRLLGFDEGFPKGKIIEITGKPSSGKTLYTKIIAGTNQSVVCSLVPALDVYENTILMTSFSAFRENLETLAKLRSLLIVSPLAAVDMPKKEWFSFFKEAHLILKKTKSCLILLNQTRNYPFLVNPTSAGPRLIRLLTDYRFYFKLTENQFKVQALKGSTWNINIDI